MCSTFFLFVWLTSVGAFSARGDDNVEDARSVAQNFWRVRTRVSKRLAIKMDLAAQASGGYVFVPSDGDGFVCIADGGGEAVVAGYSLTSSVDGEVPWVVEKLLSGRSSGAVAASGEAVSPLMSSVWKQTHPYNGLCPYYTYDDGSVSSSRCVVGCVATAASEVVRFHRWPEALRDTLHGWQTTHYEIATVPSGAALNFDDMLDTYSGVTYTSAQASAVQQLALYCGMACKMNYGVSASGSYTFRLVSSLAGAFDYGYVHFYDRARYAPNEWLRMMRFELERGVPLVYSGYNLEMAGHAFVIDGVDEDGFFHARWGEGGIFDGFFDLDLLNPYEDPADATELGRMMGHFCNQAVLAFFPDSVGAYGGDTLTYTNDDLRVEEVVFSRAPDTNGYVAADVRMFNGSADTISLTLMAVTFDSLVCEGMPDWDSAESVGLTVVTLLPGEETRGVVYCQFVEAGGCYFGLTADGDSLLYLDSVYVKECVEDLLEVGSVEVLELTDERVVFDVGYFNKSDSDAVGCLITYSFFTEGVDRNAAHYFIAEIGPGESCRDTVAFAGLSAETSYSFRVRHPWTVVYQYDFTTPVASGVVDVAAVSEDCRVAVYSVSGVFFGLMNRSELLRLDGGIYVVRDGDNVAKKFYIP